MSVILSQIRSSAEDSFPAKPTPEQLKESAPMREEKRKWMSNIFESYTPLIILTKKQIKELSGSEDDIKKGKRLNEDLDYINKLVTYSKDELAWWNANIELTPEAVNKRALQEQEKLQGFEKEANNRNTNNSAEKQEEKEAKQKKIQETLKKGWLDDLSEALQVALKSALKIFWILLGIRLGGLVANDLLYKPIAYRALAFIYSFIFLPLLLPYWIYREIKHMFFGSADADAPHFESIFPVVPYNPAEPLSLEKRLYGYPDTPALNAWIGKKQHDEKESWLSVLGGNLLQTLMQEREEQQKKA
jgi:hypothetical protein